MELVDRKQVSKCQFIGVVFENEFNLFVTTPKVSNNE